MPADSALWVNFDPSTVAGAIFWGVLAGVVTSFLLFVLGLVFRGIVIPWYQALIFEGIDLEGLWGSTKNVSGATYDYTLILHQKAHRVSGSMRILKRSSQPATPSGYSGTGDDEQEFKVQGSYDQEFKVEGSTWEGYVTLSMKSDDRKSLSFATSLLRVSNRGRYLIGHMSYRADRTDQVESEAVEWARR